MATVMNRQDGLEKFLAYKRAKVTQVSESDTPTLAPRKPTVAHPRQTLFKSLPTETVYIPRVVALSGESGAGKTFTAHLLGMLGYQHLDVGDFLRQDILEWAMHLRQHGGGMILDMSDGMVSDIRIGGPTSPLNPSTDTRHLLASLCTMSRERAALKLYEKPTPPDMRELLQWWGAEYRRVHFGKTFWSDKMAIGFAKMITAGPVVMSNYRFKEDDCWKRFGFRALKILLHRPQDNLLEGAHKTHISERLKGIRPHITVENDKGLPELVEHLKVALVAGTKQFKPQRVRVKLSPSWTLPR